MRAGSMLLWALLVGCAEVREGCPPGTMLRGNFCGAPRSSDASLDAVVPGDVIGARNDAAVSDAVSPVDSPMPAVDGPVADGTADGGVMPPVDAVAGGLALRASGIVTLAAPVQGALPTLRLYDTGFEQNARSCVGSLCLSGGIVP